MVLNWLKKILDPEAGLSDTERLLRRFDSPIDPEECDRLLDFLASRIAEDPTRPTRCKDCEDVLFRLRRFGKPLIGHIVAVLDGSDEKGRRQAAAWTLARIATDEAITKLAERLASDDDELADEVVPPILHAGEKFQGPSEPNARDIDLRKRVLAGVASHASPRTVELILSVLSRPGEPDRLRHALFTALVKHGASIEPALTKEIESNDIGRSVAAALVLSDLDTDEVLLRLLERFERLDQRHVRDFAPAIRSMVRDSVDRQKLLFRTGASKPKAVRERYLRALPLKVWDEPIEIQPETLALIVQLAFQDDDPEIRDFCREAIADRKYEVHDCLSAIDDPTFFERLYESGDFAPIDGSVLVGRISNQETLRKLATSDDEFNWVAAGGLTDAHVIKEIALNERLDASVRTAALRKVDDEETVLAVAKTAGDKCLLEQAFRQIHDAAKLEELAAGSNDLVLLSNVMWRTETPALIEELERRIESNLPELPEVDFGGDPQAGMEWNLGIKTFAEYSTHTSPGSWLTFRLGQILSRCRADCVVVSGISGPYWFDAQVDPASNAGLTRLRLRMIERVAESYEIVAGRRTTEEEDFAWTLRREIEETPPGVKRRLFAHAMSPVDVSQALFPNKDSDYSVAVILIGACRPLGNWIGAYNHAMAGLDPEHSSITLLAPEERFGGRSEMQIQGAVGHAARAQVAVNLLARQSPDQW